MKTGLNGGGYQRTSRSPDPRGAAKSAVISAMAMASALALVLGSQPSAGQPADATAIDRLLSAYPDHLAGRDGNHLVWHDGTRMPLDDGAGPKSQADWLAHPDIADMLEQPYPQTPGETIRPPSPDADPGRARNQPFFDRMYGDCRKGEVAPHLVDIVWLAGIAPQRLKVTRVNGVAERLTAISRELETLPVAFRSYLTPSAGTYNCRVVAGTALPSAHGWGIAIDIALASADYWRWSRSGLVGAPRWRNRIPAEIVRVFERHGFIWGGRWHHFDTMHFEYRPELLPPQRP